MPETAEESKFLLLESILDLLDGKIDANKMREVLETSRTSLAQIQAEFEGDFADLDPKVQEGAGAEAQMVRKFFGDWANAFEAVEKGIQTGAQFDLISAGEMVKRCSEGVNYALECYTNKALYEMGPTEIPNLNLLIRTVEEVKQGATQDKLKKIIADEYVTIEGAKQEIKFERRVLQFPEQETLLAAYDELQQGITKIGFFTKEGDEKLLDEGMEICMEAYPKVKNLIPQVNYKRMVQEPTESPTANLLINMIVQLRKGTINDQVFTEALKETEQEFIQMKNQFDGLTRLDTGGYDEEVSDTERGIQLFQEALEDCYVFLESREGLFLEQAEKELKEAAEILHKSLNFFNELADREGKTPCVRCGHYNAPDRKTCEKCGAIVPKAADQVTRSTIQLREGQEQTMVEQDDDNVVPENLAKMFKAVKDVSEGKITLEEFEDTINWLHDIMEDHKATGFSPLPSVNTENLSEEEAEIAEEVLEDSKQIKVLFEEGYRDWEDGLEYFLDYVDTEDPAMLEKGMQIMWEGNKKLNKLQRIAENMANTLQAKSAQEDNPESEG